MCAKYISSESSGLAGLIVKLAIMKKLYAIAFVILLFPVGAISQLLTWTPDFPKDNDNIEITVDASKGNRGLFNYSPTSDVYVHTGVITNLSTGPTDWRYSKFTWGTTPAAALATYLGNNKWKYSISNIRNFYGVPAGETIQKIAILFRNGSGSAAQRNADGTDMYVPVYDNSIATRFTTPPFQPLNVPVPEPITKMVGDNISLTAISNKTATLKLFLNGVEIQSATGATTISANPTLTSSGSQTIRVDAIDGSTTASSSFQFFVAPAATVLPLPSGVRDGINYDANNTSVTLVLYAPGKTRVSVIGDLPGSNWTEQPAYVMNKTPDGNFWWLRINNLNPGSEYAFQYLVDGTLKTGDPYAEKVLDPFNDATISSATYPNLKAYPTGQTTGIVSVLQTNAPAYTWTINNFSRPDKRNLIIYELLLRDFLSAHDWKTLKDTLSYFRTLGVNAIEIMPFNEFEGNESWGYNPDYFLAPDKYYGPKNTLKEFVDAAHANGIAVIMDLALNHTTGLNPLAQLYWDAANNQPAANNPWLNPTAKHPYNVFNDFNHESLQTRYFSSRVIEHWLKEYRLDGFRFDLSKGFTQNTNCGSSTTNESCFAQYDASRVAIWKRYYDTTQLKSPGSYAILEHFAANQEEIELADYGMLLWGNNTFNFQEASMGFLPNSNFEGMLYTARNWSKPHLVSYMESHDEERIMYRNLNFGNSSNPGHNIRELNTALKRVELLSGFFYMAPGPKMLWEFGELGYDFSINRCTDGSINNNCRLSNKPIRWDYKNVAERKHLYDLIANLNKLRANVLYKDVFTGNNISVGRNLSSGIKTLTIRSANDTADLLVVGNFDVTAQPGFFAFPVAGTWYDYLNGGTINGTGAAQSINLQPGEFHVFLNRNLTNTTSSPGTTFAARVYPNPVQPNGILEIDLPVAGRVDAVLFDIRGQRLKGILSEQLPAAKHRLLLADKLNSFPAGNYLLKVQSQGSSITIKLSIQ
jgi:hypothetical protein